MDRMKTIRENIKPIIVLSIMFWVMLIYGVYSIAPIIDPTIEAKLDPDLKSFMQMIFIMAIGYYISASTGQAKKDETINNLIEKQK